MTPQTNPPQPQPRTHRPSPTSQVFPALTQARPAPTCQSVPATVQHGPRPTTPRVPSSARTTASPTTPPMPAPYRSGPSPTSRPTPTAPLPDARPTTHLMATLPYAKPTTRPLPSLVLFGPDLSTRDSTTPPRPSPTTPLCPPHPCASRLACSALRHGSPHPTAHREPAQPQLISDMPCLPAVIAALPDLPAPRPPSAPRPSTTSRPLPTHSAPRSGAAPSRLPGPGLALSISPQFDKPWRPRIFPAQPDYPAPDAPALRFPDDPRRTRTAPDFPAPDWSAQRTVLPNPQPTTHREPHRRCPVSARPDSPNLPGLGPALTDEPTPSPSRSAPFPNPARLPGPIHVKPSSPPTIPTFPAPPAPARLASSPRGVPAHGLHRQVCPPQPSPARVTSCQPRPDSSSQTTDVPAHLRPTSPALPRARLPHAALPPTDWPTAPLGLAIVIPDDPGLSFAARPCSLLSRLPLVTPALLRPDPVPTTHASSARPTTRPTRHASPLPARALPGTSRTDLPSLPPSNPSSPRHARHASPRLLPPLTSLRSPGRLPSPGHSPADSHLAHPSLSTPDSPERTLT